ncbi:restriction endonuclease [Escherichia coli]|uniref:restriction endonuclease subunit S n=1 Tax=Escherichia coli TaxID=562 RepID=UPI000B7D4352|nr:restriction endonuclease subunit S [Escherichia coli]EFO2496072.1 restriction endonuclease subunit S [Escherichia coli]EFO2756166.1 restriction endonuclease subunit S [Escherichia coli]EGH0545393.1 restriction endonuclease subunit S [Escherichia coli]EGI6721874.1 restriction endonuclease subunit S [Escherichia coli]EHB5922127.1 restriction endonuclease subunit S [Escherichia coli]
MSFEIAVPEGWHLVKLSDLGEVNRGKSKHRPRDAAVLYGGKYPFIQTGDVKASNGRITSFNQTYSDEGLKQSRLWPAGTMCITIAANIAETGILQFPACFPDSVIGFIADKSKCDVYFVEYMFRLLKSKIKAQANGSVQDNINLQTLERILFPIPDLDVQKNISKTLGAFDDLIIKNSNINETLEQMAQALFKSWFVDFEPVKAKVAVMEAGGSQEDATLAAMTAISGKNADALVAFEREHPEQYAELKATAELFPSAMQESELGEFPAGWILGPLSDIAIFANEKVDISSLTSETYISTENMLENRAGISTASSLPSVNSVPGFRSGHVLISNIRPYFKKIWLARFKGGRSADVLAFEARDSVTVEYIYNLLYQDSFFDFMMLTSKGVKMPRGDKTAIMGWQCVCPDKKVSYAFSKAVGEYYSFIEINNTQNKTLTQLRDTLLPKLLSGEIILPEAEQAVSEVENV